MARRKLLCLSAVLATAFAGPSAALAQQLAARPISSAAAPAQARPASRSPSMKVAIVRSAEPGCEPHCAEWIAAQGQIDDTTPNEFRRVLSQLGDRKLPILIDSIGGDVDASLTVGRMIRAKGLDVVVTKTVIENCDPALSHCRSPAGQAIIRGRPEPRVSKCASACAFVLAGGVRRYVGSWAVVGLHEIKSISTMRLVRQHYRLERKSAFDNAAPRKHIIKEEVLRVETSEAPAEEATYEKVQRYFAEMGVDPSIMPILRAAPNSSIRWVRSSELKATALATDFLNGEQLLMSRPAAVAAVPTTKAPCPTAPCISGSTAVGSAGTPPFMPDPLPDRGPPKSTPSPTVAPPAKAPPTSSRPRLASPRLTIDRSERFPALGN